MASAQLTLSVARGEAVVINATHVTSATDTTPINISGWTIVLTARDENGTVFLNETGTVDVGASGTYHFDLTHAETMQPRKNYRFDIWRTDTGSEKPMGIGIFTITDEILFP
jgi:hypothetical protein